MVLLALLDWAIGASYRFSAAWSGGPRGLLALLVGTAYAVLILALAVRVVGGWLGFFRYARWMRPAYALTDWLVEPIRRRVPPMGGFDWSPLLAWFVLWVLKAVLLSLLAAV